MDEQTSSSRAGFRDEAAHTPAKAQASRPGVLLALGRAGTGAPERIHDALGRRGARDIQLDVQRVGATDAVRAAWWHEAPPACDSSTRWLDSVVAELGIHEGLRVRAGPDRPQRVAIFVSRTEHCLRALLHENCTGRLPCDVAFVAGNHDTCGDVAEAYGVPFFRFDLRARSKDDVEAEQLHLLQRHRVDLVVLGRYMQVLSARFLAGYTERVINIHHGLLPAFPGADPYRRAAARGVKFIGATAHYANAELDAGPIIEQEILRVGHGDDAVTLARKGARLECTALLRATRWHLEQRLLAVDDKVVVFDAPPASASRPPIAAQPRHWLTAEWPAEELERSLPRIDGAALDAAAAFVD